MLPPPTDPEYVALIRQVADRDPSIARVLREIAGLAPDLRRSVLALVAAHLRAQSAPPDVLECVAALGRDDVARRLAEALGVSA